MNPAPPATSPSCGQQPLHHPGGPSRSRCAAPESSATTRQGIKNTISPAGNVGERARRSQCCGIWRSLSTRPRSWLRSTGAVIIGRPDRPSSIVAPNQNLRTTRRRPAAAAPPRRLEPVALLGAAAADAARPAGVPASRAREGAAKMVNCCQILMMFSAAALRERGQALHCQCCRIFDLLSMTRWLAQRRRPPTSSSSIAPIPRPPSSPRTRICEQRDVGQQPLRRPGGSSRSLCSAQPRPMRLGLPACPPLARAKGQRRW
jgi:hypothetical protein